MNDESPPLVTIDSNVLVHVFNPAFNGDRHIEFLLTYFRTKEYRACVDRKVIRTEYRAVVEDCMRNKDQDGNEVILVRHWLDPDNQKQIEVDKTKPLYKLVEKIILRHVKPRHQKDPDWRHDCMFISVACAAVCKLVTNDVGHILASRTELRIEVPKVHKDWTEDIDFLPSLEAHAYYCNPSGGDSA